MCAEPRVYLKRHRASIRHPSHIHINWPRQLEGLDRTLREPSDVTRGIVVKPGNALGVTYSTMRQFGLLQYHYCVRAVGVSWRKHLWAVFRARSELLNYP